MANQTVRSLHPVIARIGDEIRERRIPIASLGGMLGDAWGTGAISAWLRGTRHPTIGAVDLLADVVGMELGAYPKGTDVDGLLARVAELEAENARLLRYVARHAVEVDEPSVEGRGWAVVEGLAA